MHLKPVRQVILSFTCLATSLNAFAMDNTCIRQVSMRFTAEHWVHSQTSLVSISINASVPTQQVDNVTEAIKTKLAHLSKTKDWHLVNLTRHESNSGLITITGTAVARLNNNTLSGLQEGLKSLNKPGEKYQIDHIDYQPDLSTINQAKSELRKALYQQVISGQQELNTSLPKTNPGYVIYNINFNDARLPEPVAYMANTARAKQSNRAQDNTSLSEKMQMLAHVTYAAPLENCKVSEAQ
ncbi:MAG: hypothetical protein P1U32_08495 [Legionellaceae bacterium]|nr:hypothetical protein [Legionellaceae bacterium]